MITPAHDQTHPYWSAYFSVRIAQSLKEIKQKDVAAGLREDLKQFLASGVPHESTAERLRKEMRKR